MTSWRVYGLIKINIEAEGYSAILRDGRTNPRLRIPSDAKKGWKRLTAIYSDDIHEVYLGTLRRTVFFYGAKVWINCPTIYYDLNHDTELVFTADLFANNRRVPGGWGKFKYHQKTTSKTKLWVLNGFATETNNIRPKNGYDYSFNYEGSEIYLLSEGVGTGLIYTYYLDEEHIPLTVTVPTIILNENEHGKLIARVNHKHYEGYVKSPDDIPQGGYITFYIDGRKVYDSQGRSDIPIIESGFATLDIEAKYGIGVHNIVATYTPNTPELQSKYVTTSGSGTLFIGNDKNKPLLTSNTPWCTPQQNREKTITFHTDKAMDGRIQLFLDLETVHLHGGTPPDYEVTVKTGANSDFNISFDSLLTKNNEGYHWNYGGYHNMIMVYIVDDPESGVPMEYWYYLDDFYIQRPTRVELVGDLNNYSEEVNGVKYYVGDNMFYIPETYTYTFQRKGNDREVSTTIGNPMRVKVHDIENPNHLVEGGYVRITVVSRTKENNMEKTTKLW